MKNKLNDFLNKAKVKFPQFDYSEVENFTNLEKDKICIICKDHGRFYTSPKSFLKSKYGCPKCANKLKGKNYETSRNDTSECINLNIEYIKDPIITDKDHLIGTVYCFINSINNKLYIGETVKSNFRERFSEHRNKAENGVDNYFYRALRKYGWDVFNKIILFQTEILSNNEENKKILNNIVNEREVYYINKYKTNNSKFGYNLTSGGDGVVGYKFSEESKKRMSENKTGEKHWNYGNFNNKTSDVVLQFDLDFNFIKEWISMSEIERELGYYTNNISRCCSNKLDTYKGFIWVKKEDYYEGYLQKYKSRAKCKSNDKEVLQYDFLGNYINSYISCEEAGRALNRKTVCTAANGRDPQIYGYIWIYKKDFSEELLQEKLEAVKSCKSYNKIIKSIQLTSSDNYPPESNTTTND